KSSHNVIEKRYRNNINDKINYLRDSVPTLRYLVIKQEAEEEYQQQHRNASIDTTNAGMEPDINLEGLKPAKKLNKATILTKSIEYIKHLEEKNQRLAAENDSL
ncbi:hypothetical protein BABINDRAFT_21863, partial [Babjeviella inositovora NRRL Y-12698]